MSGRFAPLTADDPGEVGGYVLRARLGVGGMGRVYLAFSPGGRALAVKVVRSEHAEDEEFRRRFEQEVAAARRVQGMCTVPVVDADPGAALPWLATAYVPGPSLRQAVSEHGPLPPATVLRLVAGVAEGLAAVHACGIVHRDLTPANVLLAEDGPRVIDFGIAHAAAATSLTRTGTSVGTPAFMAPEQVRGRPVTPAVDVFALGHLAVYAAVGRPAFGEGNREAMFFRILGEPPDVDDCPEEIRGIAIRCLAKEPGDRPSLTEVLAHVAEQAHGPSLPGRWLPEPLAASLDAYHPSAYRPTAVNRPTAIGHATAIDHPTAVDRTATSDRTATTRIRPSHPSRTPPVRNTRRGGSGGAMVAGVAILLAALVAVVIGPRKVLDAATGFFSEPTSTASPATSTSTEAPTRPQPDTLAAGCAEAIEGITAFNELPDNADWTAGVAGVQHLATALAAATRAATNPEVRSALETLATDLTTALGHGLTGDGEGFLAMSDKIATDGEALVNACKGIR
ncbi:serine/threonine protein kinase [Saccharothrix tamanrassetensis]|uniref:Serine/threonine protein kinase n=1 Tax=Saccharothrix tamanrassetensis TaxID=1051531 RepID=A0A841CRR0_9PSEU|nr:serine/threonine-protein kinase [Saccharothrix tamanrassetensis]MBB5958166.1 serine/threonine protein kinase [Saccharothrix tamanrassetensis]